MENYYSFLMEHAELIGFGLILLGITLGLFFIWLSYKSNSKLGKSKKWKQIDAKVIECSLEKVNSSGNDCYGVLVNYAYEYQSATYQGNTICFGYSFTTNKRAHYEIFQKLNTSSQVFIWINPNNPTESVIARCNHESMDFLKVLGIYFVMVPYLLLLMIFLSELQLNSTIHISDFIINSKK